MPPEPAESRPTGEPVEVALIANTDHAVIVADARGEITFWNPAAEVMFGHAESEALGKSLDIIIPDKLRPRHWDGYTRVMETGETEYHGRTLSVPGIRADGSRISIEFTVALLTDRAGAVTGIGAIIRDVTEQWEKQKATRAELAQLKRELADLRGDTGAGGDPGADAAVRT